MDTFIYNQLILMSKFAGLIPFSMNRNRLSKLYIIIIMLSFSGILVNQLPYRYAAHFKRSKTYFAIGVVELVYEIVATYCFLLSSLIQKKYWLDFHKITNRILYLTQYPIDDTIIESIYPVLIFICFVLNDVFKTCIYIVEMQHFTSYTTFYITNYYITLINLIFIIVAKVIIKQQKCFKNEFLNLKCKLSDINLVDDDERIISIRRRFTRTSKLVKRFYKLFGWRILFIFIAFVLNVSYYVNFILSHSGFRYHFWFTFSDSLRAFIFFINIITLINKCDKIEKNNEEFIVTCYLLQEEMANSRTRDELLHLATYAEKIAPKCSAAGFFIVNRFIIGALFSSVTTYLIICIQFNLSENAQKQTN